MWVPVFRQWGWITDLMKGSLSWWGCQLSLKDHPLSARCALIFSERGTDWVDFISRMEDPVEESFPPLQKADLPHSRSNHTGLLLAQVSIQVQLWGIDQHSTVSSLTIHWHECSNAVQKDHLSSRAGGEHCRHSLLSKWTSSSRNSHFMGSCLFVL